jgi:peroxiredoxin
MSDEPNISADFPPARPAVKLRWALGVLLVPLGLLAFEAFDYYSTPRLDVDQKALIAWEGIRAPDFSVTNVDGQAIRLSDFKGKRVILNFWATWCGPCQLEIPAFIKLRAEISPAKVVILGLSTDDAVTQRTFAHRNGINYVLAILQNVLSPYQDITKIPVTMVIDRNGVIQHVAFYAQDLKALEKFAAEPDFVGQVKSAPDWQSPK